MTQTPPFPNKRYQIIYADPPWNVKQGALPHGDRIIPYPLMKTAEIKALPVWNIANDDCILFLWIVNSMLEDALEVGKAWSFKYITVGFVWEKQEYMPAGYTFVSTEQCLIFRKGKVPKPYHKWKVKQFLSCKRRRHSEKPDEIRDRIVQIFPTQSKIELFARQRVEGWDAWGNEV